VSTAETSPDLIAPDTPKLSVRWLPAALWAFVLVLCVVPFGLVIAISFGQKIEGASWEWAFTFENYVRFFVGADWPNSTTTLYLNKLWYSFYYAIFAAVIAVITAFPFTYMMTRQSRAAQSRWLVFLLATMSLSEVFIVMGWDVLLSNRSGLPMLLRETGVTAWLKDVGWFDTLREWGLANPRDVKFKTSVVATVLTMSYLVWPYAVILMYPALSRLDQSMVEAARTMGAGQWTVVRTVVLPSVRMPLIGTLFLLFVFLLGTFVTVSVFAEPAKQTLAISVYEAVRGATLNAPFGAAQAVILLIAGGVCLLLGQMLVNRKEAKS
jgi:putative spermidine/putrescine transport system permease protein